MERSWKRQLCSTEGQAPLRGPIRSKAQLHAESLVCSAFLPNTVLCGVAACFFSSKVKLSTPYLELTEKKVPRMKCKALKIFRGQSDGMKLCQDKEQQDTTSFIKVAVL